MSQPSDPIGIFDSGVGGLSIAAAVHACLPHEDIVYFADRGHFPYGGRTEDDVRGLACAATEALLAGGAKLVVVACNTASSVALATLRTRYPVPFVGVVPGVKPATATTANRKVAVLATDATFQTQVFAELVTQFAEGVDVRCQVCPDLVSLVDAGVVDGPQVARLLHGYIDPLLADGVDTLVLGCTHYAFLRRAIEQVAGPGVTVIDTAEAVAAQVRRILEAHNLLSQRRAVGTVQVLASAGRDGFLAVAERLWPQGVRSGVTVH